MSTAVWWIRRDFRLTDNQALSAAMIHADRVVPLFVLDDALLASPFVGEKRLAFLFAGLRQLDGDLRARGSRLVLRRGDPVEQLAAVLDSSGADAIFAEEDISPYARRRDGRVSGKLPLHLTGGLTVHPPDAVLKDDGSPYTVFTPFSRRWLSLAPPRAVDIIPAPERISAPPDMQADSLPEDLPLPAGVPFAPGETEAQRRLQAFCEGPEAPITRYRSDRNRPDLEGTSRLSPYLRFGMLSARQATAAAHAASEAAHTSDARHGSETWLSELIWREFYIAILYHYPHVRQRSFRPELEDIPWDNDSKAFDAWCRGQTGYPIVDAAMRQLLQSGWMHNRARMIVASFLVKDLLVDWRWGERWFMQNLVDGDPAANNGGWQWTAGTGTDAAPYFRIFNPVTQGKKFDPQGDYVRRWVPELARVSDTYVHEPWQMPAVDQAETGCVIGRDYPAPIVDHRWARERTLAAYRQAREGA